MPVELLYREESYQLIGICMKIHTRLGKGFKEVVYKDALEVEMRSKGNIPYEREKSFCIEYKGVILPHRFIADYIVFDSIILEIKAASQIHTDNFRQTLNYLRASQVKLGLVINFGADKLEFQRIICAWVP